MWLNFMTWMTVISFWPLRHSATEPRLQTLNTLKRSVLRHLRVSDSGKAGKTVQLPCTPASLNSVFTQVQIYLISFFINDVMFFDFQSLASHVTSSPAEAHLLLSEARCDSNPRCYMALSISQITRKSQVLDTNLHEYHGGGAHSRSFPNHRLTSS